jgi:colicin import membrane protein
VSALGVTRGERTVSGALALGMHVLFAILLVFGVAWQQKRSDAPVVVDLWSSLPPAPAPKVEAPPPQAKPEPEPPKRAPAPKVEPKPLPKPDIALKEKIERERKKKREQELAEAKKREDDKRKQAALKAQKDAADAKRREQLEAALRELQAKEAAAQASARERLIDDYRRRISDKIRRFVVLPPNLQGNPEAEFEVVQIPGGEVLSVKLKRGSGNSAYDAAVERAIFKAQPLPPPPQGFTFGEFRELSLRFRPKE